MLFEPVGAALGNGLDCGFECVRVVVLVFEPLRRWSGDLGPGGGFVDRSGIVYDELVGGVGGVVDVSDGGGGFGFSFVDCVGAVSYTHLTLPTKA